MNIIQWILCASFSFISSMYYRSFQNDVKNAEEVNREVLMKILDMNKESEYGQKYNFKDIRGIEDFRKTVPITSYSDYTECIKKITRGEKNILTCEAVEFFGLSSGTTGNQKYIPVTSKARFITNNYMNFLSKGILSHINKNTKKDGKGLFLINISKPSVITPCGIPAGAGTSEGIKKLKNIFPYIWTSPIEVLEIPNQQTANYLHLLFALKEKRLSFIMAPFCSTIVQMFGVLEGECSQLVKDISSGRISRHIKIDMETRILLEKKLKPDPTRAEELKRQFSKGMKGIVDRIWPEISYIGCVAGGSFNIYVDKLKYFIGEIPIYSAVYGSTESLVGMAIKFNNMSYVIIPKAAYFEFIPVNQIEFKKPIAFGIDKLKIGESYEVVITNYSGFYRYRLGDIVKVVDYYYKSPVIEFLYRKGQILNIAAEKTQESAVQYALMEAKKKWNSHLVDYTVTHDLSSPVGCYCFYVEVGNPDLFMNNIERNRDALEKALGEANPRYLAGIKANRIAPLKLKVVRTGTFQRLKNQLSKGGTSINQLKIPRVIKDRKLILLLEQSIEKDRNTTGKKAI